VSSSLVPFQYFVSVLIHSDICPFRNSDWTVTNQFYTPLSHPPPATEDMSKKTMDGTHCQSGLQEASINGHHQA